MGLLTLIGDADSDMVSIAAAANSALFVKEGVESRTIEDCWVGLALWKESKIHARAAAAEKETFRRQAEKAEREAQEKDKTSLILSPTSLLFPVGGGQDTTSAATLATQSAPAATSLSFAPTSAAAAASAATAGNNPSAFIKNSRLLTRNRMEQLYDRNVLPLYLQSRTLIKLFDISTTPEPSVSELYKVTSGQQCTLLIVKDELGNVFGAVADETLADKGATYFGGDGCLLFEFSAGAAETGGDRMTVHKARGAGGGGNRLFVMATGDFLAFGGGGGGGKGGAGEGGNFALYLDGELGMGTSARTATYANDKSIAGGEEFMVVAMEVWAFDINVNFGAKKEGAVAAFEKKKAAEKAAVADFEI
jgi:hypothetical protein